ncbi:type II toxin-antitoxin system mRNA interferase toxin, RelE/StbE family [Desulfobacterales bacterium HSG2]|nr:type II toxin-antitoxin system mRNA interferase toxin, RelE/StbE family [Desulfobacterales bacterium HSG2]
MYKDEYYPKVRKDLKKLDVRIRKEIKEKHILTILSEPDIGEALIGDLAGIRAYHFKAASQEYRIAYMVSEEEEKVFVLMIGKRENFYRVLKRRI